MCRVRLYVVGVEEREGKEVEEEFEGVARSWGRPAIAYRTPRTTGLVARCSRGVLGGCVSLDSGYSRLRAWRPTRGRGGDGRGEGGGMRDVMPSDWRFRRSLVAQLLRSAPICLRHLV